MHPPGHDFEQNATLQSVDGTLHLQHTQLQGGNLKFNLVFHSDDIQPWPLPPTPSSNAQGASHTSADCWTKLSNLWVLW